MHSVITEDDTGHTDMKETNKRREKTILCKPRPYNRKSSKMIAYLKFF